MLLLASNKAMDQSRGIDHNTHNSQLLYNPFTLPHSLYRHYYCYHNHDNCYADIELWSREDFGKIKSVETN